MRPPYGCRVTDIEVLAMHRLVRREVGIQPGVRRVGDQLRRPALHNCASLRDPLEDTDVVLRRVDRGRSRSRRRDASGIAVVGKDAIGVERPQPLEIDEVGVEALRLVDVGDGVLHRVAAEQQPLLGQPDDGRRRRCGCSTWISSSARRPTSRLQALAKARVGRISGSIAGGPSCARSIARLSVRAARAVRCSRSPRSRGRRRCRRCGRGASG